jgi:hypothetical protein
MASLCILEVTNAITSGLFARVSISFQIKGVTLYVAMMKNGSGQSM